MSKLGTYAKAFYGAAIAFLSGLITTLAGNQNLGDLSAKQWLTVALAAVVAFGGIAGITNKPSAS